MPSCAGGRETVAEVGRSVASPAATSATAGPGTTDHRSAPPVKKHPEGTTDHRSPPVPVITTPPEELVKDDKPLPPGVTEVIAVTGDELLSSNKFILTEMKEWTHGQVLYVNEPELVFEALPKTKQGKLKLDSVLSTEGKYKSFRLQSTVKFKAGSVVLFDAERIPVGLGTWPSYWSMGGTVYTWPNEGEIDMMEAINMETQMQTHLHTGNAFPGINEWPCPALGPGAPVCESGGGHKGCGGGFADVMNGKAYNDAKGALHAMSWTKDFIKMWLWPRKDIPKGLKWNDVSALKSLMDGSMPGHYVEFRFGSNAGECAPTELGMQQYIINLTLCGDWAGKAFNAYGQRGLGACASYIQNAAKREWPGLNHGEFPHFLINSFRLYTWAE